mmetsp:Transcript_64540/g.172140  ORF Transcript_64540/g.172140 Transcript_64540/m.172140 type:complete len:208 (-) Transcript_64540:546-1169(-)
MPRSPSLATRNNRLGAVVWAVDGRSTLGRCMAPLGLGGCCDTEELEVALAPRWLTTCKATVDARKSFCRPVSSACNSWPTSPQGTCSSRICSSISLRFAFLLCAPKASQTSDTSRATRPMRRKTSPSKSASKCGSNSLFVACNTIATLPFLPCRMMGTHRRLRVGPQPPPSAASWNRGSAFASLTLTRASVTQAAAATPLPMSSMGS